MAKTRLNNGNHETSTSAVVAERRPNAVPRQFLLDQHRISLTNIRAIITSLRRTLGRKGNYRGRMDDFDAAIHIIEEEIPDMLRESHYDLIRDQQQLETICRKTRSIIQRAKHLMAMNTTKPLQRAFTEEFDRVTREIGQQFALPTTSAPSHGNSGSHRQETAADAIPSSDPDEPEPREEKDEESIEPPTFVGTLKDWGIEEGQAQILYTVTQLQRLAIRFYSDFLEVVASADSAFKFGEKLSEGQVQDLVKLAQDCNTDIKAAVEFSAPDFVTLSEKLAASLSRSSRTYRHLPGPVVKEFRTWVIEAFCAQVQKQKDPETFVHMLVDQAENRPVVITNNDVREALMTEKLVEGDKFPLQQEEQELIRSQLGQVKARLRKELCKDEGAMTRLASAINRQIHGGHAFRNTAFVVEAVRSLVAKTEESVIMRGRPVARPVQTVVPAEVTSEEVLAGAGAIQEIIEAPPEIEALAKSEIASIPVIAEDEKLDVPEKQAAPAESTDVLVAPDSPPAEITQPLAIEKSEEPPLAPVAPTAALDMPQLLEQGVEVESIRMRELLLVEILLQQENLNPSEEVLQDIEATQRESSVQFAEYARRADKLDARFKAIGKGDLSVIATMRSDIREVRHDPEKLNDLSLDELQELHARFTSYRQMLDETEEADHLHDAVVDLCMRMRGALRNIELRAAKAKPIRDTLGLLKGFEVDLTVLFGDAIASLQRKPEIEGRLQQLNLSIRKLDQNITAREQKRESTKGLSVFVNEALAETERAIEQRQQKTQETVLSLQETREEPVVTAAASEIPTTNPTPERDAAWDRTTMFRIEGKEVSLSALQFDMLRLLISIGSPTDPHVRRNRTYGATARKLNRFWTEVFVCGAGRDPVTSPTPDPEEIRYVLEKISREIPLHRDRKQRKPPNKIMREKAQTLLLHYIDKHNRLNFLPTHRAFNFIADLPQPMQLNEDQRRLVQIQFASAHPARAANRKILESYGLDPEVIIATQATAHSQHEETEKQGKDEAEESEGED